MRSNILRTPLPFLALLFAHVIWGINYVVAKVALQEFPVMSLGFLRFALATILILPFLASLDKKDRQIKPRHLITLAATGLLLVTFNIVFFYEGLKRTTAIDASALNLTIPVLSVFGSWIFLKEKIFLVNFLGIILAFLGALIVIGLPLIFVGNYLGENLLGNLLIVLSATVFVAGSILSKKLLTVYHPLLLTTVIFFVGAATFFIPALAEYAADPGWINHVSLVGIFGLAFIAVLSSVVGYILLTWALSKTGLVEANMIQYVEPAVAATFAVPFLGERISYSFIIGTCLIVLGVYWGTLGKPEHHHTHHKSHRI